MQTLDHSLYLNLREGADVLEADGKGDKVLRLADGSMLKLFRRKRLLTSALWAPYAQRFADNCQALRERAIECPRVRQVYRIPSVERDAVHYDPLLARPYASCSPSRATKACAGNWAPSSRACMKRASTFAPRTWATWS